MPLKNPFIQQKKQNKNKNKAHTHIQWRTCTHTHYHSNAKRHTRKSWCANTLHTHAYAICRTSPSQPEDKGAVVARQQVSLAPTHLEAASAPTISVTAYLILKSYTLFYSKKQGRTERSPNGAEDTDSVRCRRRQIKWPSPLCWM